MDPDPYRQVEALFRLFRERGLVELSVEDGCLKLHLRREAPGASPVAARPRGEPQPIKTRPRAGAGRTVAVRSPLIGVFYRSAAPDAPPFVEIGDVVSEGQTVCIVEAMKIMNEIEAEITGIVREVCVEDAQPVEYGQVLFRVDPNG